MRWSQRDDVAVTTLESLIAEYGRPDFCKIDIEGAEYEVIRTLREPLPALSFEAMPATADQAIATVRHLSTLGPYRFNFSPSESMTLRFADDVDCARLSAFMESMTSDAPSGDVYACLA